MRPKLSVIVPCYNAAATVERALDSLAAQTLPDLEIIAVNDGSTDQTMAVLQHYQQNHPDLNLHLYTKPNEGIAACRNYALDRVSGEYLGFLDADDETVPEMFAEMTAAADQSQAEVVVSDFFWKNSKGEKLEKEGPYETGPDMMVHLFATLWNKIYRTDFIRQSGVSFPDGCRYEDDCFLYRLVRHVHQLYFMNRPYVRYYQVGASITHTSNEQVRNMIRVFEIITQDYRVSGTFAQYHDALEYIHIRAFLGSNFLRSARIEDRQERKETILLGWNLLNETFPHWRQNPYLRSIGGAKNRYFRIVNRGNLMFFAWLFRHFLPENL